MCIHFCKEITPIVKMGSFHHVFKNKHLMYFTPPSVSNVNLDRAVPLEAPVPQSTYSMRSARELYQHYCDPNDPCCAKHDPEIPIIPSKSLGPSRLRVCAPRNPLHFEYTIAHRRNFRTALQLEAERQLNPELTEEEWMTLFQLEAGEDEDVAHVAASSQSILGRQLDIMLAPPPKPPLVDPDTFQSSLEGLTNMALAHEIALNKDFKLTKPDKSHAPLSPEVEFVLSAKEKYWRRIDKILLRKDAKSSKATIIQLLQTLKTMLLSTILPHNLVIREKVKQELDERTILRHIEQSTFDFQYYLDFVVDTLASLCCPIRDKEILEVRTTTQTLPKIKLLVELMEDMNLDMANFILSQSRNTIVKHCTSYERNKFATFIETQVRKGNDPLRVTREWIERNRFEGGSFQETMSLAFTEVLAWESDEWPETLALDWLHFPQIREEVRRVTLLAAMVSAVYDYTQVLFLPKPEDSKDFEKTQANLVKNHSLMGKLRNEFNGLVSAKDITNPDKLPVILERCCVQALKVVESHKRIEFCGRIKDSDKDKIRSIILQFVDDKHPTRSLYDRRVKEWFMELIRRGGHQPVECPHNLNVVSALIFPPITEMLRLSIYNRGIFDIIYVELFLGNCAPPRTPENGVAVSDPMESDGIAKLLTKLNEFSGRTTVYRKSRIDPRIKPVFDSHGQPIVDREYQPYQGPVVLPEEVQKQIDKRLLMDEPTLDEDYEGVRQGNVGEPGFMMGHTTEDLLKMLERDNIINANKLRRIKERREKEDLERRIADNLPVFPKQWGEGVSTLQKEFCRLTRIIQKGPTPLPPGAVDELTSHHRAEPLASCHHKKVVKPDEFPKFNEKGERIFYSRNRGRHFGQEPDLGPAADVDIDALRRIVNLGGIPPDLPESVDMGQPQELQQGFANVQQPPLTTGSKGGKGGRVHGRSIK